MLVAFAVWEKHGRGDPLPLSHAANTYTANRSARSHLGSPSNGVCPAPIDCAACPMRPTWSCELTRLNLSERVSRQNARRHYKKRSIMPLCASQVVHVVLFAVVEPLAASGGSAPKQTWRARPACEPVQRGCIGQDTDATRRLSTQMLLTIALLRVYSPCGEPRHHNARPCNPPAQRGPPQQFRVRTGDLAVSRHAKLTGRRIARGGGAVARTPERGAVRGPSQSACTVRACGEGCTQR